MATHGAAGIGSELDEALVRAGSYCQDLWIKIV